MKFTTLLPTHLNDGTEVADETLQRIVREFAVEFGGSSVEGMVDGIWFDSEGAEYTDRCLKLTVVCDNDRFDDAQQAVLNVGRELGQLAMYFEVRDFDGVRFLDVPQE